MVEKSFKPVIFSFGNVGLNFILAQMLVVVRITRSSRSPMELSSFVNMDHFKGLT